MSPLNTFLRRMAHCTVHQLLCILLVSNNLDTDEEHARLDNKQNRHGTICNICECDNFLM